MQGKRKWLLILMFLFLEGMRWNVWGYSGKGTSASPYIVENENDLKTILTTKGKSGWVYIGVQSNVTIKESIKVGEGKFRIYAKGANRYIRRSTDKNAAVNKKGEPKYCFRLENDNTVEWGYGDTKDTLVLDGKGDSFSNQLRSSGMIYIEAGSTVIVGKNCCITDVKNNKEEVQSSPIYCAGLLQVKGEIKNGQGMNGGAVYVAHSGMVELFAGGKIHHCTAGTEGGAIYVGDDGNFTMRGGEIYECSAKEEGGALFIYKGSYGLIETGKIHHNKAGNTGGGVFSGMGAFLEIGSENLNKPYPSISNNTAGSSGGGIRCNGGISVNSGGTTRIYAAIIENNQSGSYGGGISCAGSSEKMQSKFRIENTVVSNNQCENSGGGLWLGTDIRGIYGGSPEMTNCQISENVAKKNGGGIRSSCYLVAKENVIQKNRAVSQGGGLYLDSSSAFEIHSGKIAQNIAGKLGAGILLNGKLKLAQNAVINVDNRVYLCEGTFVEVIEELNKKNQLIASLESERKETGTKLVKVTYQGGSGAKELYVSGKPEEEYKGISLQKKYQVYGLENQQCLRPSEKVTGLNSQWIIISEKYLIQYHSNTVETVLDMPENHIKFWNEQTQIAKNEVTRNGYCTSEKKHWNTMQNGTGTAYFPGAILQANYNLLLYAQWEKQRPEKLMISTQNRYYVVGQKITLTNKEVLKKVLVTDDLNTGDSYKIEIKEIRGDGQTVIAKGDYVVAERYLSTSKEMDVMLVVVAKDASGKLQTEGSFRVVILAQNNIEHPIRFVSKDYVHTLSNNSKWVRRCEKELQESLDREEAEIKIQLNALEIKQIKKKVENNQYKITRDMNREVMEQYGGTG